jgi:hypothetical protein
MDSLRLKFRFGACLLLLCGSMTLLQAQSILYTENFESDGEGSRYTSNTFNFCTGAPGGNPDYFLRTNTNPVLPPGTCTIGFGSAVTPDAVVLCGSCGSFFWASEDIRSSSPVPNANPPGDITTNSINVTGYGTLTVSLFLGTGSNNNVRWESADSINIQASLNAGPFRTVGRFTGEGRTGGRLRLDANLDGTGEGTAVDQNTLAQYTFSIPGTGSNLRIKLDFDQIGGTEEIAVDLIQVTGIVVVPVQWASFTAEQSDETVTLNWATTSEVNAKEYQIERLAGDGAYQSIGTVPATGQAAAYAFTDIAPVIGSNHYRIRQVDQDNSFTYSEVVEVNFAKSFEVSLYPNPTANNAQLSFNGTESSGRVLIFDGFGRFVRTIDFNKVTSVELQRNGLAHGLYHIRLEADGQAPVSKKLLIAD